LFIFDLNKSRLNLAKHGIDFVQAQLLWEDLNRVEKPSQTHDERRFLLTGAIDGTAWTAVVTYRDDLIRIISVRRARKDERKNYFSSRV